MYFTTERPERFQRTLTVALNQEWPQLSATQKRLAELCPTPTAIRPAQPSRLSRVATVATDGGENKLSLEPMQLQVVPVAVVSHDLPNSSNFSNLEEWNNSGRARTTPRNGCQNVYINAPPEHCRRRPLAVDRVRSQVEERPDLHFGHQVQW